MNILRWNRKSKNKINPRTIILFIFSLIMTTFAWFAYSKVIEPTLNIHMSSWDMEYYIGETKKTNPIDIEIPTLYPNMAEHTVTIDIYNNGETLVDIEHIVQSVTIAGTTYEIVQEGSTPTSSNYIALAQPVLSADQETYKTVITNDITRFPFTVEMEYSAQVVAVSEDQYGNNVPGEGYLKVTVNWIGDNNLLDSEWGYIVGEYFANNPTATSAMSIVLSIDSYQVDPSAVTVPIPFPSTETTKPYLPSGFSRVPGTNLTTGLVIEDSNKNQYVWIEVPMSASIYTNTGLGKTSFDDTVYSNIEKDLRENYLSEYTSRADAFSSRDAIGINSSEYTTLKNKMLKSIYTNGGFYIGRYETGTESGARTESSEESGTPVIKANVYPFNYISIPNAHALATSLAPSGYNTSLMFGLQWDLVIKYLNSKGATKDSLTTDSTLWGNYADSSYSLTNSNVEYLKTTEWLTQLPYEKEWDEEVLITSGGNSGMCKQNIYDLAGNLSEWTYNVIYNNVDAYLGGNGGSFQTDGIEAPANTYGSYNINSKFVNVGFRVALY